MNDVNELWNSQWRTLQKNLARGIRVEGSGVNLAAGESPPPARMVPSSSWLVRAHGRKTQVTRKIQ